MPEANGTAAEDPDVEVQAQEARECQEVPRQVPRALRVVLGAGEGERGKPRERREAVGYARRAAAVVHGERAEGAERGEATQGAHRQRRAVDDREICERRELFPIGLYERLRTYESRVSDVTGTVGTIAF